MTNVDTDTVYPSYMMICTAAILFACSLRIYLKRAMSLSALFISTVIQLIKLGNLLHISLGSLACAAILILNYTLPFLRITSMKAIQAVILMHKSPSRSSEIYSLPKTSRSPAFDFAIAAGFTGFVTLWVQSTGLIHELIDSVFAKDTPFMKEVFAILSFYLMYIALLLLVFYPFSPVRGMVMLASLVSAILSTEYIDPIYGDNYEAKLSSFHIRSATQHAPFFLLVSCLLCFLAAAGILPIKQRLMRVVFIFTFAFCASMALFGVSFSEPLPSDKFSNSILNIITSNYTWFHCFTLALGGTSVALHIASSSIKKTAGIAPYFSCISHYVVAKLLFLLIPHSRRFL